MYNMNVIEDHLCLCLIKVAKYFFLFCFTCLHFGEWNYQSLDVMFYADILETVTGSPLLNLCAHSQLIWKRQKINTTFYRMLC